MLCSNPLPQSRTNRQVTALDYCVGYGKLFKNINDPFKEEKHTSAVSNELSLFLSYYHKSRRATINVLSGSKKHGPKKLIYIGYKEERLSNIQV